MRAFCTGCTIASLMICPIVASAMGGSVLTPVLAGIGWAILALAHRPLSTEQGL